MTKAILAIVLGVLALGVGTFSTTQRPNTNPPATWTVVGVTALNNMMGTLNQTLFTPPTTGMYRLTYYSQVTLGRVNALFTYTNGLGVSQYLCEQQCESGYGDDVFFVGAFQAKGGTPVLLTGGAEPGIVYNMSITIERLETSP